MSITCMQCNTTYKVSDTDLGETGRKVRCIYCDHIWHQMPQESISSSLYTDTKSDPEAKSISNNLWLKILALTSILLLSIVFLLTFRERFPVFLKPLYEKIGIYETSMLKIQDIKLEKHIFDEKMDLVVSAYILNTSPYDRIAPGIKVAFYSANKRLLKDIYFASNSASTIINPGKIHKSVKRIKGAPKATDKVSVDIVNSLEATFLGYY